MEKRGERQSWENIWEEERVVWKVSVIFSCWCPLRKQSREGLLRDFRTASMIASYPLHKASLSFQGGVGVRVFGSGKNSSPATHPSSSCFFSPSSQGPTPHPPSLLSVSFHCRSPLLPHLVVVSVQVALSHFSLTLPLCPSLPPSLSAPSPFPPSPPVFVSCCQELFNMRSYICCSPFSHPSLFTHSYPAVGTSLQFSTL